MQTYVRRTFLAALSLSHSKRTLKCKLIAYSVNDLPPAAQLCVATDQLVGRFALWRPQLNGGTLARLASGHTG